MTSIQWTDETWNPVRGCSVVSEGCRNCYAMKQAHRFSGKGRPYEGLTKRGPQGPVWTGQIRTVPEVLAAPLHWRKPKKIFVNSMSDLFHEDVPDDFIKLVLRVICAAPQHTFQVLTKRPERMRRFMAGTKHCDFLGDSWGRRVRRDYKLTDEVLGTRITSLRSKNLWLGVSVEDQKTADERIPILLQTPAAVRWISAEPLLGPVNIAPWLRATTKHHFRADVEGMLRNRSFAGLQHDDGRPMSRQEAENALFALHAKGVKYIPASSCDAFDPEDGCKGHPEPRLDWVIVGGESGPGSRPCDVAWIRSIVEQCRAAAVPCFVKQLGSYVVDRNDAGFEGDTDESWPMDTNVDDPDNEWNYQGAKIRIRLKDRKGGDPAEWPADLRVREWPR